MLFDSGINEGNSYIPVDGRIAIIKQQQQQQLWLGYEAENHLLKCYLLLYI